MSNDPQKRIGGEYGEVRANINVEQLNAYLVRNVKDIHAPIEVKQFKVSKHLVVKLSALTMLDLVWTGDYISNESSEPRC